MEILKKTLYPKTKRVGSTMSQVVITEKLDGSNLGLFRRGDELIIAQRNNVFQFNPVTGQTNMTKNNTYKGLIGWLEENGRALLENLHDGAGVFGEWIGMGKINYSSRLDKRFYIFAKANIKFGEMSGNLEVYNIYYDHTLFIYPFINQEIPSFMGVVPKVWEGNEFPQLDFLDKLYLEYTYFEANNMPRVKTIKYDYDLENTVPHLPKKVEGFIINNNNVIQKYVRFKNGKLTDHVVNYYDRN